MTPSRQHGFTLVELAIALMVIGLLITGVLKGQELIGNSRNVQLTKELKEYQAAVNVFKLNYEGLPGDILEPNNRLPKCSAAPCNAAGNNNKIIGTSRTNMRSIAAFSELAAGENRNFWVQLAITDNISGVDATYNGAFTNKPGIEVPKTPLVNTLVGVTYYSAGGPDYDAAAFVAGNFLLVRHVYDWAPALTPTAAAFIDAKMDDGNGILGDVKAAKVPGSWETIYDRQCVAVSGDYVLTNAKKACNLFVMLPD